MRLTNKFLMQSKFISEINFMMMMIDESTDWRGILGYYTGKPIDTLSVIKKKLCYVLKICIIFHLVTSTIHPVG